MVGVQVEFGRHGSSSPTVQEVTDGRGAVEISGVEGVVMHCPSQGCPEIEICVGVQVADGRHGSSSPTVHGVTDGNVGTSIQSPRQGFFP